MAVMGFSEPNARSDWLRILTSQKLFPDKQRLEIRLRS